MLAYSKMIPLVFVMALVVSMALASPTDNLSKRHGSTVENPVINRELAISGATNAEAVVFVVMEGIVLMVNISSYASRVRSLQLFTSKNLSFSRVLMNMTYAMSITFVGVVLFNATIWGMRGRKDCILAINFCLVFYLGGKVILYFFMIERLRAIRQPFISRCADLVWQRCFLGVVVIFGQIALICFFYPIESVERGYCTIGLPTFITVPMLGFDIACSLSVSLLFFFYSRQQFGTLSQALLDPDIVMVFCRCPIRIIRRGGKIKLVFVERSSEENATNSATESSDKMSFITRKTFWVSVMILLSTAANLGLLYHYHGAEHGWMCYLACSCDITWNVGWLTFLTGLPTEDESPNRVNFANRRENFENLTGRPSQVALQPLDNASETVSIHIEQPSSYSDNRGESCMSNYPGTSIHTTFPSPNTAFSSNNGNVRYWNHAHQRYERDDNEVNRHHHHKLAARLTESRATGGSVSVNSATPLT